MEIPQHTVPNGTATGSTVRPLDSVGTSPAPPIRSYVFTQGTKVPGPTEGGSSLYRVVRGRVRILGPEAGPERRRHLVALLGRGDVFGSGWRQANASHEADHQAVADDVEVLRIDAADLAGLSAANPRVMAELVRELAATLDRDRRRSTALVSLRIPSLLAMTLVDLANRHGAACSHGGEVDLIRITQQDIADLMGASRAMVSTLINQLKVRRILGSAGRVLCLHDLEALRTMSRSDGGPRRGR